MTAPTPLEAAMVSLFESAGWTIIGHSSIRRTLLARRYDETADVTVTLSNPVRIRHAWGDLDRVSVLIGAARSLVSRAVNEDRSKEGRDG